VADKFVEVVGKMDNIDDPDATNDFVFPIVPTFSNNDILPGNIFTPGPNKRTRHYLNVWKRFVPQAQKHSFARGGWFCTEVIPKNKLAVVSLNTLYLFDPNSAIDGCDIKSEPGYEHMEWLRI
jgi:endopolyphosphatase